MRGKRSWLLLAALICAFGCSDGGDDDDDGNVSIEGRAFLPPSVSNAITISPVFNSPFDVVDLTRSLDTALVAQGNTDETGRFQTRITRSKLVAVIVFGKVRVSGLVNADPDFVGKADFEKNFNGATDIACEAGFTAVTSGAVPADVMTEERIRNLESAAEDVIATGLIDFEDPASVSAGAEAVRQLTDDGAHPLQLE